MSSIGAMKLWCVKIAERLDRYVYAPDPVRAVDIVREELVEAMSLRAEPADRLTERRARARRPESRARLLMEVDDLCDTPDRGSVAARVQRLEEALRRVRAEQEWIERCLAGAPPMTEERYQRLIAGLLPRLRPEGQDPRTRQTKGVSEAVSDAVLLEEHDEYPG
jgi:hypothetical protein